ncbi:putative membrane protein [Thermocatellispora tengchongensis]|uniref:Putative membrane protein n=1 Tax=Thermocatellispora tengchongensis TaxID=1073253 RepID=A0A840PAI6_9ACTN|nr:DUF4142 domain-containing protein [Thermocatellispora tengchongensis]MBB5134943.1 putative membrane protein [Thermocatellispora tengchongensis]
MIKGIVTIVSALAVALFAPAAATAATPTPGLSDQDRTFLVQAHQANLFEIAAGEAAQQKGTSQAIRDLGGKLITDHRKLDENVRNVAEQLNVDLPDEPSEAQSEELDRIEGLSGAEFDRAWVTAQIAGHRQTLADGAKQLEQGQSEQVKQLATDAKPVIEEHLQMLQELEQEATGTPTTTPTETTPPADTPDETPT